MVRRKCLSLQRERRNQVEPRYEERWHLRDDEQFDLAAWFLLPCETASFSYNLEYKNNITDTSYTSAITY